MILRLRASGYLGGNVSFAARQLLLTKHVLDREPVDRGWQHQCRCGGTLYSLWRRRWYCRVCGRWELARVAQEGA